MGPCHGSHFVVVIFAVATVIAAIVLCYTCCTFLIGSDARVGAAVSFSNMLYLRQDYMSVSQKELRSFLLARLKVFYEEELDVPLVL